MREYKKNIQFIGISIRKIIHLFKVHSFINDATVISNHKQQVQKL